MPPALPVVTDLLPVDDVVTLSPPWGLLMIETHGPRALD